MSLNAFASKQAMDTVGGNAAMGCVHYMLCNLGCSSAHLLLAIIYHPYLHVETSAHCCCSYVALHTTS